MALPKLPPKELAEDRLMDMSSFGSFHESRGHVNARCGLVTFFKGKTPGNHVAENDDLPSVYGEPIEIPTGEIEGADEHVLAMISKAAGGRLRFAKGKGKGKGRDVKSQTCVNCGKKGNLAIGCRAPKVVTKDRPCFKCREKGTWP